MINNLTKTFTLKGDIRAEQLLYIHPHLVMMIGFVLNFAGQHGVDVEITSLLRTPEENKRIGAVSSTHIEGRAVDISLRTEHGWTNSLLAELEEELLLEFGDSVAALVWQDGRLVPRPMVVHDVGSGPHIHLQCRP